MIVVKKHISRRAVLRSAAVAIGLPLLDGMCPALSAQGTSRGRDVRRFGAVYVPMGMNMAEWTPVDARTLELSPTLTPMSGVRERLLVVSGLGSHHSDVKDGGPHPRLQTAWLTGVRCKPTEGADIHAGISMDQIAARELGKSTQLDSLQVGIETNDVLGTCAQRYSCAYSNTISWRGPSVPVPMENNPRVVFERLFGVSESTDRATRLVYLQADRSVLDSVVEELARFRRGLATMDQKKMDQYTDSIRDVERRIRKAEAQSEREIPFVEQPSGIPTSYEAHVKLMFDLLVLAYQMDFTRVFSFLLAREASNRAYPEIGVADAHHPLSHHRNNPMKLAALAKVNRYHVQLVNYFVERLRDTSDGEDTLLDNTVLLLGSGMGDPQEHQATNLPSLVVAGRMINLSTGRHLRYPSTERLANLQLALLEKLGIPEERFGDSTSALSLT